SNRASWAAKLNAGSSMVPTAHARKPHTRVKLWSPAKITPNFSSTILNPNTNQLIAQSFLVQQICQTMPPNWYASKLYRPLKPWTPQGYPGPISSTPTTTNLSATTSTPCQPSRPFPPTHKCGSATALNTRN